MVKTRHTCRSAQHATFSARTRFMAQDVCTVDTVQCLCKKVVLVTRAISFSYFKQLHDAPHSLRHLQQQALPEADWLNSHRPSSDIAHHDRGSSLSEASGGAERTFEISDAKKLQKMLADVDFPGTTTRSNFSHSGDCRYSRRSNGGIAVPHSRKNQSFTQAGAPVSKTNHTFFDRSFAKLMMTARLPGFRSSNRNSVSSSSEAPIVFSLLMCFKKKFCVVPEAHGVLVFVRWTPISS